MIVAVEMPSGARSKGFRCGTGSRKEQDRDPLKWYRSVVDQLKELGIEGASALLLGDNGEEKGEGANAI